jgi:hypothetical protein
MHVDNDEDRRETTYIHPHLSTVTYDTSLGSLVLDTSQLQGRLYDASILAPFLGRVCMIMTTGIMAMAMERSITRLRQ